jgi:hypothetical protein
MKYIIISTNDDSYGTSSDAQIAVVKKRMEIISDSMRLPCRYADTQCATPDDSHADTELVFELAMGCRSKMPASYAHAVCAADAQFPLQYIILNEHRGDYITRINWGRDGSADIHGTDDPAQATTYTRAEAQSLISELGRGFAIEEAAK